MSVYTSCMVLAACCLLLTSAVVIPRPPSSMMRYSRVMVVTSSELPKQIPAPSQSPHHSSTPQYAWAGTLKSQHKTFDQRTDLMPNMI